VYAAHLTPMTILLVITDPNPCDEIIYELPPQKRQLVIKSFLQEDVSLSRAPLNTHEINHSDTCRIESERSDLIAQHTAR